MVAPLSAPPVGGGLGMQCLSAEILNGIVTTNSSSITAFIAIKFSGNAVIPIPWGLFYNVVP